MAEVSLFGVTSSQRSATVPVNPGRVALAMTSCPWKTRSVQPAGPGSSPRVKTVTSRVRGSTIQYSLMPKTRYSSDFVDVVAFFAARGDHLGDEARRLPPPAVPGGPLEDDRDVGVAPELISGTQTRHSPPPPMRSMSPG